MLLDVGDGLSPDLTYHLPSVKFGGRPGNPASSKLRPLSAKDFTHPYAVGVPNSDPTVAMRRNL
jgi:hypothetical protein